MFRYLRVKNYALIDDIYVEFKKGFNILTGETGGGKSILVKALSFLLGEKGDPDAIRTGEKYAEVEGEFDGLSSNIKAILEDAGIETRDKIIIRRLLKSSGKTKTYINDMQTTVKTLKNIGDLLFDIHGQHQHQLLMNEETHLDFLDAYLRILPLRNKLKSLYFRKLKLEEDVHQIEKRLEEMEQRKELTQFQREEIDRANIVIGEDVELEKEKSIITHIEQIVQSLSEAKDILYESEDAVYTKLSRVLEIIRMVSQYDKEFSKDEEALTEVLTTVDDLYRKYAPYLSELEFNPERLNEIEERLILLDMLKKKYGGTLEKVIVYRKELEGYTESFAEVNKEYKEKKKSLDGVERELNKLAGEISQEREKGKKEFEDVIKGELSLLGMGKSTFIVEMEKRDLSEKGVDGVKFLISLNPGEAVKPLNKIASGGEISRIMLGIKSILSSQDKVSGLVFDEIDVGIGGRIAEVVGKKMKSIGKDRQVLCITHLPQIAVMADYHLKVEKVVVKNRTKTLINPLNKEERIEEIARMVGGEKITKSAKEYAEQLLNQ